MKSVLIKDTTRAQREEIVRRALCDGGCDGCSGCGNLGGGRVEEMYRPYIEGKRNCGKSMSPIVRISFAAEYNMLDKMLLSTPIYVTYDKLTWFCRNFIMIIRQLSLEKPVQSW